jgi:hypothetical protein
VLATASIPTDRCSTSIKRVDQFPNVRIVELFGNLDRHMFVVTVAVRNRIQRQLAHTMANHRVSFSWEILGITTAVSDH